MKSWEVRYKENNKLGERYAKTLMKLNKELAEQKKKWENGKEVEPCLKRLFGGKK